MKTVCRQLERLSRKTGLNVHALAYKDHVPTYKEALNHAKNTYYSTIIAKGQGNARHLPAASPNNISTEFSAFTTPRPFPFSCFSAFSCVDEQFVSELITKSKPSTCPLDPMPTCLTNSCLPVLCPVLTKIINMSLLSGSVHSCLKTAAVTPILKNLELTRRTLTTTDQCPFSLFSPNSLNALLLVSCRSICHTTTYGKCFILVLGKNTVQKLH